MKLVVFIYLIFAFSAIAQDSTNINLLKPNDYQSLVKNVNINHKLSLKKSLVELKMNREWRRTSNYGLENNYQNSSLINYKKVEPNFIDSDLFLVVVGSAVVFGATAAYYKLESDALFQRYGGTNNKSKLEKIDRYDLYSGLALGALEINFGFLIYKFLTD